MDRKAKTAGAIVIFLLLGSCGGTVYTPQANIPPLNTCQAGEFNSENICLESCSEDLLDELVAEVMSCGENRLERLKQYVDCLKHREMAKDYQLKQYEALINDGE